MGGASWQHGARQCRPLAEGHPRPGPGVRAASGRHSAVPSAATTGLVASLRAAPQSLHYIAACCHSPGRVGECVPLPARLPAGHYPEGAFEGWAFCRHAGCQAPKPPGTHHCRTVRRGLRRGAARAEGPRARGGRARLASAAPGCGRARQPLPSSRPERWPARGPFTFPSPSSLQALTHTTHGPLRYDASRLLTRAHVTTPQCGFCVVDLDHHVSH